MAFNLETFHRPYDIGFRVEVHDDQHPRRNSTFDQHGNMRARDPSRPGDAQACRDHLRWRRPGGPFISFFTNWNAALRRHQWMIDDGATKVVIVAVWLKGSGAYDAFRIAHHLHLESPDRFLHEVLVYGGISADSYRILAMFHGRTTEDVALSLDGMTSMARMPGGFTVGDLPRRLLGTQYLPDPTNRLRDEIHACTGTRDDAKLLPLALSMANIAYSYESNAAGTAIICPLVGRGWCIDAAH